MHIPYIATNFPEKLHPGLNGSHKLNTTWADIVWSAITVGKPGISHLLTHRWHSLADIVVRTHIIYANLYQNRMCINRSTLYDSLDPSEKGATSYFLGMVMAKLFAAEFFSTPWLFHTSQARVNGGSISFERGTKSQPDLIGQNTSGDWIVVEAKGRSNGFDSRALAKAKEQTAKILAINGAIPSLKVALQVYFENQMRVCIDDPNEVKPEAHVLTIELDSAFARYYSFAHAIDSNKLAREVVFDREYVTHFDVDSGVTIGLQSSIYQNVLSNNYQDIRMDPTRISKRMTMTENASSIYPDGLLVRLDTRWSSHIMSQDSEARDFSRLIPKS